MIIEMTTGAHVPEKARRAAVGDSLREPRRGQGWVGARITTTDPHLFFRCEAPLADGAG
jgi:hypothetical protein